ncbi:MAG TPA: S-adenosylmethionine:tRNA ribosyltransferase-isomerase [Chryseosolibacter sp.]
MININDYRYELPDEKIALFPLASRDESKLLVYRNGEVEHSTFKSVASFLPAKTFLFFNDTKVIPARIHFKKDTGADIEIFLLAPVAPSPIVAQAMAAKHYCSWQCTIGNLKRWKEATLTKRLHDLTLTAELADREKGTVRFSWESEHSFAEIVSLAGETPLPPYLKRKAEPSDKTRYQTIYSHHEGAVAAPTAGLHFTDKVFESLKARNIGHDFLTLHVSAGTFQPVKVEDVSKHVMHHEQVVVTQKNLDNLLAHDRFIIPVGTTSMRTLESIYWYGAKLLKDPAAPFEILQDDPYQDSNTLPSRERAIRAVKTKLMQENLEAIGGTTSIFIKPGYDFKICSGLITNFHQPGSTLMLLVAAFVGRDWKKIYHEALQNDYRFLSFGDSSLLLPTTLNPKI